MRMAGLLLALSLLSGGAAAFQTVLSRRQQGGAALYRHTAPLTAWPWEQQSEAKDEEPPSEDNGTGGKKPGISMQGLVDLMALGAGAPNLGKFTGVDEETGES